MLTTASRIPQANAGRVRATPSFVAQQQLGLSQGIIPAVPGEFYSYPALFTTERPLFALMKCKANKARLTSEIDALGMEAGAFFRFGGDAPNIFPIKEAQARRLLTLRPGAVSGEAAISTAELSPDQFFELQKSRDQEELVRACTRALSCPEVVIELHRDSVVALMTSDGRYCVFLVEEITHSSIQIEACHILL
jgi:hypothetical protein